MKKWFLAFRPKTLTAAVVPILVGTTLVGALGYPIQFWISLFALFASLFIQIGTNLINDAMDFKKGADTHERIGPSRITQQGQATFTKVFGLGLLFFLFALILGIPLVFHGGWPIVLIGSLAICFGYAYTGGPYPLAYRGLGDLFVILFFGVIAVSGIVFLHTSAWHIESLMAGLQVGSLATVLIAINNFRDREGDQKANKKTLAVRFGPTFVRFEITFLILVSFAINFYWWFEGFKIPAILSLLSFPLGFSVIRSILKVDPSPVYNKFLARSALLHILFGTLLSLGFYL
jgi:1,4-dihydroxy-2-naphthoate octaprenyltransferase